MTTDEEVVVVLHCTFLGTCNTTSSGIQQGGGTECLRKRPRVAGTDTARPVRYTTAKEPRQKPIGREEQ